jgi:putative hydrolase of the HAD superfamily
MFLFDLGNTLARYYQRHQFPGILQHAISNVSDYLQKESLLNISPEIIWQRVENEDHETADYSVRCMENRLANIFQPENPTHELMTNLCRKFMEPIFALGKLYEEVLPVLEELGQRGIRKAIISNTPWGSPAELWREEIKRLNLDAQVELTVFCRDVGWRKPARQIFYYALERLKVEPKNCTFVGDDPGWDIAGPESIGMRAILIDRAGKTKGDRVIRSLYELLDT